MVASADCIYCGKEGLKIKLDNYVGIARCNACGKRQRVAFIDGKVMSIDYDTVQWSEDMLERIEKTYRK